MDETEVMLADAVAALLRDQHHKERLRKVYQGQSAYDLPLWSAMAEQGWLSITLAEELGGVGLQSRHAAVIAHGLGHEVVPEPFVNNGALVARLANALHAQNPEGWQGVVAALQSGEAWIAPAWQESMQDLEVTPSARVTEQAGQWVLSGTKVAVVGAEIASHFLVTATDTHGGAALWLVPRDVAGVSVQCKVASDGGTVSQLHLEQVSLQAAQRLAQGPEVVPALRGAVAEAIALTAAQLNGVTAKALEITLEYLRTRQQFGKAIGSFQSLQHLAVDVRVQQSLAQAAVVDALRALDEGAEEAKLWASVGRAKARASAAAQMAGRFGVQAHGAIGFAAEADIGLYLKAALRLSGYLGNAAFHRQRSVSMYSADLEAA